MMASSTPKSTTTLLFLGICILFLTSTQSTTYVPLFHAGSGMYTMEVEMGTPGQSLMLMVSKIHTLKVQQIFVFFFLQVELLPCRKRHSSLELYLPLRSLTYERLYTVDR